VHSDDPTARAAEVTAFWDWALLELLLSSGLRVEEACELTTFDILKRQLGDGRVYYRLHIKPSKFDRARVIPIGDQLGHVIAEITRHVRAFYGTNAVPPCDRRDIHEKTPPPRAPYLLQGAGHPSVIGVNIIRGRLRQLSTAAQSVPRRRDAAGAGTPRLSPRLRIRTPQHHHPSPRHRRPARTLHIGHQSGLRQALPHRARRVVPTGDARRLHRRPRLRGTAHPDSRRVDTVQRQLLDARHGHPPVRPTHR
jgi:hypothetical protein